MRFFKYLIFITPFLYLSLDFYPESAYVPVLMKRTEMEKALKLDEPREIVNPGKIYFKSPYLFIVEKHKGIHVIDNSNPAYPVKFKFIQIDGIRDMAIKTDILFADNAVDLVAIQLNNTITTLSLTKRLKNYFPEMESPDGMGIPSYVRKTRPENTIIVSWKLKTEVR